MVEPQSDERGSEDGALRELDVDDVLSPVPGGGIRNLPPLLRAAFRIVNGAAKRHLRIAIALQLSSGLIIAAQLVAVRLLLSRMIGHSDVTFGDVIGPLVLLATVFGLSSISSVLQSEQNRLIQELTGRYTAAQLIDAATSVDLIDFERPGFHDRLLRAQINAQARPSQMVTGAVGVISAGFSAAGITVGLLIVQPVFVVFVVFGFGPAWVASRRAARASYRFTAAQVRRDRHRNYLASLMLGRADAKEIRAYDLEPPLRRRYDTLYDGRIADVRKLVRDRTRTGLAGSAATAILAGVTLAGLVWYATSGRTSLAAAGAATAAMLVLIQRLQSLQNSVAAVYESSLFIEDFTGFVEELLQRRDARPATPAPPDPKVVAAESVSFRYFPGQPLVLSSVSLEMRRGEVVALVGENGSGKTTLAKILAGLFSPTDGRVTWDGVDLADRDPASVRDRIAILFQDFGRFQLAVADNIEFGRWREAGDSARRDRAAERGGFTEIVAGLPHGYDTPLGPEFLGGTDLSIGQWQRLALTRAIFRDAPIVILDEPTASLDPKAEFEMYERMRGMYEDAAVLLISHRFASVRSADRIYVLDHGRVVEEGHHDALMKNRGLYADLFTRQAAGYLG